MIYEYVAIGKTISETDLDTFKEKMAELGHPFKGQKPLGHVPGKNGGYREELQGKPQFKDLNGPLWGGTREYEVVIRYETAEAYRNLSI